MDGGLTIDGSTSLELRKWYRNRSLRVKSNKSLLNSSALPTGVGENDIPLDISSISETDKTYELKFSTRVGGLFVISPLSDVCESSGPGSLKNRFQQL